MITLAALAELATAYAEDLDHPVTPIRIGETTIDTDERPAIMGVVNLSRDSSYRESIATSATSAIRKGRVLAAQGADVVDIGAESSNGTSARVAAREQIGGLVPVIEGLAAEGIATSIESYEPEVVRAGLTAGARVVNLTGSAQDEAMFDLAAEFGATLVLCHVLGAHARDLDGSVVDADPFPEMLERFGERLERARACGVRDLVIDPGLGFGFTLDDQRARARHQARVLLGSFRLRRLGVPVCHSLPHSFELFEDQFRSGEAFFAVLAALGRTGMYRTHEIPPVLAALGALDALDVWAAEPLGALR